MRWLSLLLLAGCATPGGAPPAVASSDVAAIASSRAADEEDPGVDVARARALERDQRFAWEPWSPEVFARAKREGRFILVHGAASWCHWCHVMEDVTYHHPEVGAAIAQRFVAVRVDIDARPDIEERYAAWGWPATVLLSPDGEELAKYRGFMPPEEMLENLAHLERPEKEAAFGPTAPAPTVEGLTFVGALYAQRLHGYYDAEQGGWGFRQKTPLGPAASFELRRHARTGDGSSLARALSSLDAFAKLIDPVWGGIYQYSTHGDWEHPHFEKLMSYQAENLIAFAEAYRSSGEPRMLAHARAIEGYMSSFLRNEAGAYLVSQDADVGGYDHDATFVDGHDYFVLGDQERRTLGMPRVDESVYAEENGLAILALVALYEVTGDVAVLERAERAAGVVLASHVDPEGRVGHDATKGDLIHLSDGAVFGLALAHLARVVSEGSRYQSAVASIADALVRDLRDEDGAFWAHTPNPAATGVFARRRKPHEANVMAARLLLSTGREGDRAEALRTLAAISSPAALDDQGRMIAPYLIALEEAGLLDW